MEQIAILFTRETISYAVEYRVEPFTCAGCGYVSPRTREEWSIWILCYTRCVGGGKASRKIQFWICSMDCWKEAYDRIERNDRKPAKLFTVPFDVESDELQDIF